MYVITGLWCYVLVAGEASQRESNPRGYELLDAMKKTCHIRKPEVISNCFTRKVS